LTIVVYCREACDCCRKALALLEPYRKRHKFRLETIDVDGDAQLAAEHGASVPVVAVNGKVRFRGVVNPVLLERLLENL
jgi:glutaredoxin